jgi:hypothetical protein
MDNNTINSENAKEIKVEEVFHKPSSHGLETGVFRVDVCAGAVCHNRHCQRPSLCASRPRRPEIPQIKR